MSLVLPPNVSEKTFAKALDAFAGAVGRQWVLATDEDRAAYMDIYAPGDADQHLACAAVGPQSAEEVQAVVRIANEYKIPLSPVSRGKNLGYGAAAPRMSGTVVLDLGRMKRILEVNERFGYCLIEPGVGFFDLFRHLQDNKIPLWMSVPSNAWGSVVGNALERGYGYTPYGDNTRNICGLEVVLPNGELVRTGTGAMANSRCWQLFKYGYGPSWDQLFVQSNFGVVTKMGMWLMPEPEATLGLNMQLPNPDDVGWAVDALAPLRLNGVLQQSPSIGNSLRIAASQSQRSQWYQGEGAMPDDVLREVLNKFGLGWWNIALRLYGYDDVNESHARIIKDAFARHTKQEFQIVKWHRGDPIENSGAGVPSANALQLSNWRGGRGGHLAFSPVLPPSSEHVLKQFHSTKKRYEEIGVDYYGSFTLFERHTTNINLMIFDCDDAAMTSKVRALFKVLVADAAREGYSEYRTHLSDMDAVALTFDFNNHALLRLNETVKDALDPNGILAPGKQGVWPRAFRGSRA
ncbi:MAG TPA: FAD-binding oxidoreductase [Candidatus Acidoferrales bacterium]|nr:FAD-binding oxidoreductase [Candidatus Acidoferrales bacterium]